MTAAVHGTHITFGRLLLAAYQARERVRNKNDESASNDPAIAVIMCITAVEAMLGELAQISDVAAYHGYGEQSKLRDGLTRYAHEYGRISAGREGSKIRRGLDAALRDLCGRAVDWGRTPYQDFDLLVRLRNDIVHGNLGELVVLDDRGVPQPSRSKLIVDLQQKGLIHRDGREPQATRSSFDMAMTLELANWAIKSTRIVMGEVLYPAHLEDAGLELQAVFTFNTTFPLILSANGISEP